MSSWETAALTIIGGVVVYVLGRVIERAFIEPVNEQARLIVEVVGTLGLYAYLFTVPVVRATGARAETQEHDNARLVLRSLAARLRARNVAIPWYRLWWLCGFAPRRAHVQKAVLLVLAISKHMPPATEEECERNKDAMIEIEIPLGTFKPPRHLLSSVPDA